MHVQWVPREKNTAINGFVLEREVDIFCLTKSKFRYGHRMTKRSTKSCHLLDTPLLHFLVHRVEAASPVSKSLCRYMCHSSQESRSHTPPLNSRILPLFFHNTQSSSSVCIVHLRSGKISTDAQFLKQFLDLLELGNSSEGSLLIMGDLYFQLDQPSNTCTSKLLDLIDTFDIFQSVTKATHQNGHILDWIFAPSR